MRDAGLAQQVVEVQVGEALVGEDLAMRCSLELVDRHAQAVDAVPHLAERQARVRHRAISCRVALSVRVTE